MSTIAEAVKENSINLSVQQDKLKEKDEKYKDWTYVEHNGKNIPFKKAQSIHTIWDRVLQHQKGHMWSGILLIGQSGSGKTTLVNGLIHYLHTKGKDYEVHRMSGDEINDMDKVIENLTVGRKHLMFFDDASYSLGNLTSKQVDQLKASLTTIRHKVQANVIGVFATHYTKALDKFFRSQAVMIFTSTSATEKSNLYELFRKDMNKISIFGKVYTKAVFYGYWDQTVDMFEGDVIRYKFSEPFRPVLVCFGDDVRACLVRLEECDACNPTKPKIKLKGFDPTTVGEPNDDSVNNFIGLVLKKGIGLDKLKFIIGFHFWLKYDTEKYIPSKEKALLGLCRDLERYSELSNKWWEACMLEIQSRIIARREVWSDISKAEIADGIIKKRTPEELKILYSQKRKVMKDTDSKPALSYTKAKNGFGHGKRGQADLATNKAMEEINSLLEEPSPENTTELTSEEKKMRRFKRKKTDGDQQ